MNPTRFLLALAILCILALPLATCGSGGNGMPTVSTAIATSTSMPLPIAEETQLPAAGATTTVQALLVPTFTATPTLQPTSTLAPTRPPIPTFTLAPTHSPTPTFTLSPTTPVLAAQQLSPANATQVVRLNHLGQGALQDMAWLQDGQTIVAIHKAGITLYDAATLAERQVIADYGPKYVLAASPDGRYLAIAASDKVQLWDVESGQRLDSLGEPPEGASFVAFHPDGRRLVTIGSALKEGTSTAYVALWDAMNSKQAIYRLESFSRGVSSVALSPDGKALVTSTGQNHDDPTDTALKFWDAETGQPLAVAGDLAIAPGNIDNLVYSPDGHLLAGADIGDIYVWEVSAGDSPGTISGKTVHVLNGGQGSVTSLAFSADGKLLASGAGDKTVKVWDVASGLETMTIAGHTRDLVGVAFSPSGEPLLATATAGDGVQVWSIPTGQRVAAHPPLGHTDSATAIDYSPDGRSLATAGLDETLWLWEASSGQPQRRLTAPRLEGNPWCACYWSLGFSPDGRTVAAGSTDATVRLWRVESGELAGRLDEPADLVSGLAFSPDGRLLAAGDGDGNLWVWDLSSGLEPDLLLRLDNPPTVLSLSFSPDGHTLAAGSGFGAIRLWDIPAGHLVREMQASDNAVVAVSSPDGSILAAGSSGFGPDYAVRLWNPATGEILRTLEGHTTDVKGLAFSPDGRLLASCDGDGFTRLWDAGTGQPLQVLQQDARVYDVAFSPDGTRLATAGSDGLIWVWGIP